MNSRGTIFSANAIPVNPSHRFRLLTTTPTEWPSTLNLRWVLAQADGSLTENNEVVQVDPDGTTTANQFPVGEGDLISATLYTAEIQVNRGELFARLDLISGGTTDPSKITPIAMGYVSTSKIINYPLSAPEDSMSGITAPYSVTIPNPAAGDTATISLPANSWMSLHAGSFALTADANVGDRDVLFAITDAGAPIVTIPARTPTVASATNVYYLWSGPSVPADTAPFIYIPIPDPYPVQQLEILIDVSGIQVGDQLSTLGFRLYPNADLQP